MKIKLHDKMSSHLQLERPKFDKKIILIPSRRRYRKYSDRIEMQMFFFIWEWTLRIYKPKWNKRIKNVDQHEEEQ